MTQSPTRQAAYMILGSLAWAIAYVAAAMVFKGDPIKDWVHAGLIMVGAVLLSWQIPRMAASRPKPGC